MMRIDNRELLDVLNETVEFLESPKVLNTAMGNTAYLKAYFLKKQIAVVKKEIEEEDNFIEMLAERAGL